MNRRVLIVDDEPQVIFAHIRNLGEKFQIDGATGADEAIAKLQTSEPYAVILTDLRMPGLSGIDLLRRACDITPDTVRMLISGNADLHSAMEAVNGGAVFRILEKPCPSTVVAMALEDGLRQHQLITSEKELLNKTLNGSIQVLIDLLTLLDPEAFGHATWRKEIAKTAAKALGVAETWDIEMAALLCDIGRLTLPPEIIQKVRINEVLSKQERELWVRMPDMSAKLLGNIPRLESVARGVLYQNKSYDGTGFPEDGVKGQDIPMGGRILRAITDLIKAHNLKQDLMMTIESMRADENRYDPYVVNALPYCIPIFLRDKADVPTIVHKVKLTELNIGQMLRTDIKSADGLIVLTAGQRLNAALIQKIRNFANLVGIQEPIEVEAAQAP